MIKVWFYHYKLRKRVYVTIPSDVWPKKFKEFAQTLTRCHDKIIDSFTIKVVAEETGVKYDTAEKYLEILEEQGVVKRHPTLLENSYILACTPEEEFLATRVSTASLLAARRFKRIYKLANRFPIAANIIHYRLTRVRERIDAILG